VSALRSTVLTRLSADLHDIPYASRYDVEVELPKYKLPENGCDAKVAYQLLHDELELGR
jgi:glutamate decarboxylase